MDKKSKKQKTSILPTRNPIKNKTMLPIHQQTTPKRYGRRDETIRMEVCREKSTKLWILMGISASVCVSILDEPFADLGYNISE
jgi:hypothetical protein